jgi:hypothetical protein
LSELNRDPNFQIGIKIINENLSARKISIWDIAKHYFYSIKLEVEYNQYLKESPSKFEEAYIFLQKLRDVSFLLLKLLGKTSKLELEKARLRRFDNINLAHFQLLKEALKSNFEYSLLLEDDALIQHPSNLPDTLSKVSVQLSMLKNAHVLSLSFSNNFSEMGVQHLFEFFPSSGIFQKSAKPFTNSVCANLYSKTMVDILFSQYLPILDRGIRHFVPFDQILNMVILLDQRNNRLISTFHMKDPIFNQMSMVDG